MGLQLNGSAIERFVKRFADVQSFAFQLEVVLTSTPLKKAVTYAGDLSEPLELNVGAVHTTS